ncbi:hypothetical protein QOZ80_9AG0677430 [Eleusine coracana subsp. coracana]|nr:hypothetical protein QOZ80_9AG0677430 [Eleusine coracana subsp. coracana]
MEARNSLGVLLLFMLAFLAATTFISLPLTPCSNSMSRAILAATSLDPYLISCGSGDTTQEEAPLSKDNHSHNNRTARRGGPIVTDQLWCSKPADIPQDAPLPPSQCCPPMSASPPINFTFPDITQVRMRRPVHEVGPEYMAKYERVVALMKALAKSDPRSFYQQGHIHCAYCSGAYKQVGLPTLPVQVHFSWLFFPFHRAYLYYFERIARKLLNDPEFTLPFWSWDIPEGMQIPAEFVNKTSPLYDALRDPKHQPPNLADLDFNWKVEKNLTGEQQIQRNMCIMYKQIVSGATLPSLFYGQPYRAGDSPLPGPGTVELAPHANMHAWIGNGRYPNGEDMGAYYAAGRDPIFYIFHGNIDRIWEMWRDIRLAANGNNRSKTVFSDHAWLDSSFLFYDEEARLVRVTVRDMLDTEKLGYKYSKVAMPWATARPPRTPGVNSKRGVLKSVRFPVSLDAAMSVEVMRPDALRSRISKDDDAPEEVLVVEGIEVQDANFVKLDVYVNAVEYHKVRPGGRELAGSFVSLRHPATEDRVKTTMRVALNELLEDLGVKEETSVTVTIIPVTGKVKIGGLKIVHMSE